MKRAKLSLPHADAAVTAFATPLLEAENQRLMNWVHDLQSGMFINCVYCGHRYGPQDEVPATMADVLKQHIAKCPKHPMSELIKALEVTTEALRVAEAFSGGEAMCKFGPVVEYASAVLSRAKAGAA